MPLSEDDTKDALLRLEDIKTTAYDLSLLEGWTADQRFVLERISYSVSELEVDVSESEGVKGNAMGLPSIDGRQVWFLGRAPTLDERGAGEEWEVMGVFNSKEEAASHCKYPRDFVAPLTVGELLPDDHIIWPSLEWPLKEDD